MSKKFKHNQNTFLQIDTAKIYYEDTALKNKEVLLLLHGGFGNIEDLNPFLELFKDKYRVLAIDSRGHGASTLGREDLTYKLLEEDVYKVLNYLNINKLSILGFSDGGIVSYRLASSKKLQIDKLVTIGSSWSKVDLLETKDILSSISVEEAKEIFEKEYNLYEKINSDANFELLTNQIVSMWLDESESGYPDKKVENIDCETLLTRGDEDFLVSASSLEKLSKIIPNSSFLNVPFASHAVHQEQFEFINLALQKFFELNKALNE